MTPADYLRQQAQQLRALARETADPKIAGELNEMADRCEKLANEMGGNGKDAHH